MNFLNMFSTNLHINAKNTCFFIIIVFASATMSVAVPDKVAAFKTIGDQIIPYVTWGFAMGGGAAFSYNAWRVFQGQPKAAIYAMGGLVLSGLGFDGIFGTNASTLMI